VKDRSQIGLKMNFLPDGKTYFNFRQSGNADRVKKDEVKREIENENQFGGPGKKPVEGFSFFDHSFACFHFVKKKWESRGQPKEDLTRGKKHRCQ